MRIHQNHQDLPMNKQFIGADLSRVGGYTKAIQDALALNANCIQLFTNSPRRLDFAMDKLKPNDYADLERARSITTNTQQPFKLFIHSPYIMNMCDMRKMTLNAKLLHQQLQVCDLVGGIGVVVHTGSNTQKYPTHHAYEIYVRTIREALKNYTGPSRILLETSAGQGHSIGVSIEAFSRLYLAFSDEERRQKLGIVIDTCHIFAAGYDISTSKGVQDFHNAFHTFIPKEDVKLFHLNDSKKECGTCVDRHTHLGDGFVFEKSMDALKELFKLYPHTPFVLETHDKHPYPLYRKEIELCHQLYQDVHNTSGTIRTKKTMKRKHNTSDTMRTKTMKRKHTTSNEAHTTIATRKQAIIQAFLDLAEIYHTQQDKIRGDSYYEGAYILDTLDTIPPTKKELKQHKGVGDAISDKTIEMLYTGKMNALEKLKCDPTLQHKLDILRVSGIGIKKYEQLVEQNITTLQALKEAHATQTVTLTHAQTLGLTYYDDLQSRIPHREAKTLDMHLQTLPLQDNQRVQFVGSYRRKKPTSGDIDILLCNVSISDCIAHIEKKYNIVSFITKGREKASFLMVIDQKVRHIDLLTTTNEKYVCALMYFTGSKLFNIKMRWNAKKLGYVLNEHRLTHIESKKNIVLNEEKDVFRVLNMKYVKPEHR